MSGEPYPVLVCSAKRTRPAPVTDQVTRIINPVGHRRVEKAKMLAVAAPGWHVIVPDNDDDWCCDVCSTRLDPHAPIIVAGSYALCADEAKDVLANNDLVVVDCRCPGCQRGPNG